MHMPFEMSYVQFTELGCSFYTDERRRMYEKLDELQESLLKEREDMSDEVKEELIDTLDEVKEEIDE